MELLFLIIEFSLIFWAITFLTNIKITIKRVLAFILVVICPTALNFVIFGQWLGIIYFIVSSFTYFYWLARGFSTLIHICLVVIIGIIADNLAQFTMVVYPYDVLPGILEQYIIFIIIFISCAVIYKLVSKKIYQLLGLTKTAYVFILSIVFITMCTFYINLYLTDYFSQDTILKFNIFSQLTYFGFMCIVLYITIINLKKENHFREIEIEKEQFADYMHSLELINHDMQKFRHDYANILSTMQGYMEINDLEGLKNYFKQHIMSAEGDTLKRNQRLANLSNLHITGIKGLLLTKALQAEKEGIEVDIEIPGEIEEIAMNVIDISRILGIFLDNAIEATSHVENGKEINIAIMKSMKDSIIIIIENTVQEESILLEQIFKEGFSTKGENRGKGLSTVQSIINQYPDVMLNTNVENGLFIQKLEVEMKMQSINLKD